MFKIDSVLKRSWQILWNYKVLWIFGFLLAITSGGSSGGTGGSNFSNMHSRMNNYSGRLSGWPAQAQSWLQSNFGPWFATPEKTFTTILWVVLAVVAFAIVIGLLLALVRYPAEAAVLRMVDDHEQTGSKLSFKQGWHLGWNRRAFRMWVIDLIMGAPGIVFGIVSAIIGFSFVHRALLGQLRDVAGAAIVAPLVLLFMLLIVIVLLAVFLGILRQYMVRYAAIEGTSIGESLSQGWSLFKRHAGPTFLTWIVLVGVKIVVGIAMILVVFLLIPTYVIMAIPGTIVAAIPGGIAFGITTLINPQVWPWIIGALVAIPFFFLVTLSPLSFVEGWIHIFSTNSWTLAFRQLRAMEAVPPVLGTPYQPEAPTSTM